jgi:hypothetical protein
VVVIIRVVEAVGVGVVGVVEAVVVDAAAVEKMNFELYTENCEKNEQHNYNI